jgi:FkbM family methyltransferase
LLKIVARRGIVDVDGLRLYLDPLTHLGFHLLNEGTYEPDFVEIVRRSLPTGGTFLDIGANEGFYCAIAAAALGGSGRIVAVEPQSRLRDIIEINTRLNGATSCEIHTCAIGTADNATARMSLTPSLATGASSLAKRYRWNLKHEAVRIRSLDRLAAELNLTRVDLMKVDVEGFEVEVIKSGRNFFRSGAVKLLALDYHGPVLRKTGTDPGEADRILRDAGYTRDRDGPLDCLCFYSRG